MFDRRLLTDTGLALLIALPTLLPAAPNPWTASGEIGRPDTQSIATPISDRPVRFAQGLPVSEPRHGRS